MNINNDNVLQKEKEKRKKKGNESVQG